MTPDLAFVATAEQACRLLGARPVGPCVVVSLDEAASPPISGIDLVGADLVGLSELGLDPRAIAGEAVSLADDLLADGRSAARVERWLYLPLVGWLLYGVHAVRAAQAALTRFRPARVWIPPYEPLQLQTEPSEDPTNPLFFDLLPEVCSRLAMSVVHVERPPADRFRFIGRLAVLAKYVVGQWITSVAQRPAHPAAARPVLFSNIDNDLHRQFELPALRPIASQLYAWLRGPERVVPVEEFLDKIGPPKTLAFGWLKERTEELRPLGAPAGVRLRWHAGVAYLCSYLWRCLWERRRRGQWSRKYTLPWWDLLFGSHLPRVHWECRLAAAYYAVFEYERARSVIRRWRPALFVGSDYWSDLPRLAAARDLGVTTLSTSAGLGFYRERLIPLTHRDADVACVYGPEEAGRVQSSFPNARVVIASDTFRKPVRAAARDHVGSARTPRRVLIVLSGRLKGWWFGSLVYDYRAYVEVLRSLAHAMEALGGRQIAVLKSHPVTDLYDLYDGLVRDHRSVFVEHRRTPLPAGDLARFDAAVVVSCASTLVTQLIALGVPVIYFSGGLTDFGREFIDARGLPSASTVDEIMGHLSHLGGPSEDEWRTRVLSQAREFMDRHLAAAPRSLADVLLELGVVSAPGLDEAVP
jgi:hypothetical protein